MSRSEPLASPAALRGGGLAAQLGPVGLLVVVGLAAVAVGPYVLDTYTVNILVRSLLYACVALTVDILWGYTGILTFGQSAFFGIGAYAAGLVFSHFGLTPANAVFAFIGAIVVAGLVAALVGWLAFGYGVTLLYVSVVTLALPIIVTQIIYSGGTFTGSSSGLSGFDTFDLSIEGWFWIAGTALVLLTGAAWLFVRSDAGRLLVAIRENEQRCAYLGVATARVKILLLVVAAVVAAAAGYAYAGYTDVIAPELAGFVFGTELVIWVALGGRGTLLGPVIGTIAIDLTSAYLSGNLPFVWQLILGLAFVIVIVAWPQGLLPLILLPLRRLLIGAGRGSLFERPAPHLVQAAPVRAAAQAGAAPAAPALELDAVTRRYGSLLVLEKIALRVSAGELLSLVGPNGAGKTTLMRCISDGHERSAGRVLVGGRPIGRLAPERCVALGIGRKFQTANVFETLTVVESLRIARTRLDPPSPWRRRETLALPRPALEVIEATGLGEALSQEVTYLSHGMKQALELAMVLALEPRVLLLDEPTAGLTKPERALIGNILVDLARQGRLCILLVEHDLDFVHEISSRVVVLHQGRIALDGTVAEIAGSELVKTIYSGESHAVGTGP